MPPNSNSEASSVRPLLTSI